MHCYKVLYLLYSVIKNAFEEQQACERALKEYVGTVDPTYAKTQAEFYVGFEGSFGSRHVTPRTLACRFLGNMVCIEGIVTKSKNCTNLLNMFAM